MWLAQKIKDMLYSNRRKVIDSDIIDDKLFDIDSEAIPIMETEDIYIPVGPCHGDLTFSNMKVCDGELWVFDHLDSYIESPIMDAVKLLQDIDYYWSLRYTTKYPTENYFVACSFLRSIVYNVIKDWGLLDCYPALQYVNLARILPYLSEDGDKARLRYHMGALL